VPSHSLSIALISVSRIKQDCAHNKEYNYLVTMTSSLDSANFSAPPHILEVEGVLTDFDGTIIDSTDAIVKHWHK